MPARIFSQLRLPQIDRPHAIKKPAAAANPKSTPASADISPGSESVLDVFFTNPSMEHLHLGRRSKSKDKTRHQHRRNDSIDSNASAPAVQHPQLQLNIIMESPPVLLLGSAQQSTGALISGRLQLTPGPIRDENDSELVLDSITMSLECATTSHKPAHERCRDCATHVDELKQWSFLSRAKTFKRADGTQDLPFNHLLPGNIPTTTRGRLVSIEYSLYVRARTADGRTVELRRPIPVMRALPPGADRNSMRVFPPTELTLRVTVPNIIYPIGQFPVQCRLSGITAKRPDIADAIMRWRLRKLTWRIDERESAISLPCAAHASSISATVGKGIQHEMTREIGGEELREGWKTDFSNQGEVEGEFFASIDANANPQCSVESASTGLHVSHTLTIELVVAEEWVTSRRPNGHPTPTGAARVLRAQFNLNLSQRSGLGIAWDDETPPMYEDVPDSPPHYSSGVVQELDISELHGVVDNAVAGPS